MYAKHTGNSRSPQDTMDYLGTDSMGSNSVAHNNPKKREYLEAKKLFHDSGNPYTYRSWREARVMALDAIYMKRDLRTISNMKGHTNADFAHDIEAITKGNGRKIKSYEFILSPDPKLDPLDPHNKRDVDKFAGYCKLFQHVCFDGKFVKTGYRNRRGNYEYHYHYELPRGHQSRFYHLMDIQCDSTHLNHLHCHFVEVSHDRLENGRSMQSQYSWDKHLMNSVQRTTDIWNRRYPNQQFSGVVHRSRTPDRVVEPLIKGLNQVSKDVHVKSLKAFRDTLKNKYHIQAVRLRKTKHRVRGGWKFRYKHKPFIKASRLQRYQGLAPVFQAKEPFSKSIPKMLSKHRKQFAKLRHQAQRTKQLQHEADVRHQQAVRNEQREEAKRKYVDGSPELPTVKQVYFHGHPLIIDPIQKLADDGTLFKLQDAQEDKIEASHDRWVRSNPRRLARYYEHDDPSNQVVLMMKHLSSNPVRKSVPKVSNCYQKQCFPTYSVQDAQTGRREFRLLDGKLGYTHSDKGWFSRVFGGFVKDWNAFRDKAGRKLVHSAISRHWKRFTTSVKGYIRKHVPTVQSKHLNEHLDTLLMMDKTTLDIWPHDRTGKFVLYGNSLHSEKKFHNLLTQFDKYPKHSKMLSAYLYKQVRKYRKFYPVYASLRDRKHKMYTDLMENAKYDPDALAIAPKVFKHNYKVVKIDKKLSQIQSKCLFIDDSYVQEQRRKQQRKAREHINPVFKKTLQAHFDGILHPDYADDDKRIITHLENTIDLGIRVEADKYKGRYFKLHPGLKEKVEKAKHRNDRAQAARYRAGAARYKHTMKLRHINARRRNQQQGPTLE